MNRRRIVPAILIFACFALGAITFIRLQANSPRRFYPLPDKLYPLDQRPSLALTYAAEGTIRAQLTAIRGNDLRSAEGYESKLVMEDVASPDEFRLYATEGYPEIAYFDRIKFGDVLTDVKNQRVMVGASVTGADKATVHVSFLLMRDEDGVYRIVGLRGQRGSLGVDYPGPRETEDGRG